MSSISATDAAFRTGCVLDNLLMGFRETVLPACWFERRLRAVRDLVWLVGADLIPRARTVIVRFAVPREERPAFLERLRTLANGLPIAAQFEWDLTETDDEGNPYRGPETTVPAVRMVSEPHGFSP
jgi:hypothetical protein